MRDAAAAALAEAFGLPAPGAEAPVALLESAYAVTHDVARADAALAQTHVRSAGRLPGESLPAAVDTNPVLVELAHARAPRSCGTAASRRSPSSRRASAARVAPAGVRGVVSNHVALDGGFGQRLALHVAAGITLDAVLLLPAGWDDEAPGVLIALDERGKAHALASAGVARARARGWAVLAPDLRGTGESAASEFELATAAWLLDRDLLVEPASTTPLAAVQWLSERYSTGQQIDARRIAVWGSGAFGLVALLAAVLDERIAGAAGGPFAESLEELLVESPAITPMAYPFAALEAFDLRRPRAPRAAAAAARRRSRRRRRRGRRRPARRRRGGRMIRELADGIWSCEQDDGPAHRPPGRGRGRRGGPGRRHRPAGRAGAGAAAAPGALRASAELAVLITHPDSDHLGGTAELLAARPDARVLAGRLDLPLVGDPERMIRERYARFAEDDDVPFGGGGRRARASARRDAVRRRRSRASRGRRSSSEAARRSSSRRRATARATSPPGSPTPGCWPPATRSWAAASRRATAALLIPPMYAPPAAYRETIERVRALPRARARDRARADPRRATRSASFLDASRAASDRLAGLVAAALDDTPRTLLELCRRVHAAYGGLPDDRVADLRADGRRPPRRPASRRSSPSSPPTTPAASGAAR